MLKQSKKKLKSSKKNAEGKVTPQGRCENEIKGTNTHIFFKKALCQNDKR